jgi:hypothetical protein
LFGVRPLQRTSCQTLALVLACVAFARGLSPVLHCHRVTTTRSTLSRTPHLQLSSGHTACERTKLRIFFFFTTACRSAFEPLHFWTQACAADLNRDDPF